MKKRFLKIILMLSVLLVIIPITSATCEEMTYNDCLTYEINEGGKDISIVKCISDEKKITVPDEIDGLPVTVIKEEAFASCSSMGSVVLSKNLTTIGEYAFNGCTNLRRLSIPDKVTTICDYAFKNCSALGSVTIPSNVVSVGSSPLYGCGDQVMITYRGDFKDFVKIYTGFSGRMVQCNDYLVSNVQSCGEGVAYFIQNDDTVIIAGEGAIKDDSVVSWRIRDNIKTVIINEGVTGVGSKAFYEYANLESITVPDSVTSIGYQAFYGTAFANNDANREDGILYVNNILIDANDTIESVCTIKEGTKVISDSAFNGCTQLTSVIIPDSVTSIGQSAFEDCSNLTSITIPDSVTSIGQSAFDSCRKLTSATIGSGVESIGAYAFEWCSGLTSITIPDSVTSIGNRAFYECNNLTSVTIGSGVKSIGFQVFYYCSGIESVYISDMAKWCEIEFSGDASNPMYYSTSAWFTSTACKLYLNNELVSELIIPDGISEVGNYTFCGCGSITSITILEGVTNIGEGAFYYCKNLTSVTIPNSVTSIGESAFAECSGLTSATIPNSVTSIGESAFAKCSGLTSVTISDSVESIGNSAFSGCSGLTSVTIPNSVTSISNSTFSGCAGLTSITIPDNVKSIGESTFAGCSGLKSVTIGSGVESIGNNAFSSNDSLTSFNVDENNANYSSEDGVLFNKNKTTLLIFPKSKAGDYIIPDSVTRIEDNAFYNCKSLTSIKIPDTIKEIGSDAFTYSSLDSPENVVDNVLYVDNCLIKTKSYRIGECSIKDGTRLIADNAFYDSNLKSVTIPDSVTSIGNGAFDRCYSLTNVTMGSGIERIGKTAFNYCRNLTSITIGSDVKRIGEDAFTNCNSLESVYITDLAAWCAIDFANESSNPLRYVNTPYLSGEMVTELVIPDGVTSIGKYAFRSCDGLTNVIIPDSVTSIGKNAFQYCSGLTSVTIGNGVTSIGESVFASCSGLTSVTIGSGIESIGEDAFYSCGNLTGVYISDIAKWCAIDFAKVDDDYDIDSNPLRYAKKLYLNNEPITDLVIPDSVTSIGKYAFCYCKDLTSVTLGSGVESIGEKAFYYCDNLESVYISDIAKWCAIDFANASSSQICYNRKLYLNGEIVTDIVIPDGVTSIAKYAFYNCRELTSVTIPVSVTSIGDYAFTNCNLDDVYYDGTETRWAKIDIGENNYNLNYASKHFSQNSDPEPDPMPTPLPEITAEITKTDSDTAYEFTVTPENPSENCSVYAAVYDENGTLLAVSRETLQTSGATIVSVDKSENEKIAKVFIWVNKTLQPVLKAVEFSLTPTAKLP